MNSFEKPAPRFVPPPQDPALDDIFSVFAPACGGFVPNAVLIMQHRPKLLRAFVQLTRAISDPETSEVDNGFKRLLGLVASRAAGCSYCMSHTAASARISGVEDAKLGAVCDYRAGRQYSEAERAALDVAFAAGKSPNEVTDEMFANLRRHWTDGQIVEIVAVIAQFGFLNRWNDTFATPIEDEALALAQKYLAPQGWEVGRHFRSLPEPASKGK